MNLKSGLSIILLLSLFQFLFCDDINVTAEKTIDWEQGNVTIDITASSETAWTTPSSRYNMDNLISKRAPVLTAEIISDIPLDSLNTIGSAIRSNTSLYGDLLNLPDLVGKTFSTATEDRKSLTVRYNIPIYPHIARLFIDRQAADPLTIDLRYIATADFTGIIIYAGEKLPLQGTNREIYMKPSIFPKLYDENLTIVLDMSKVEPDYLKQWGTAGFTIDEKREYYGDRVGAFPLRTMAISVFGKNGTDLILPSTAVRRILSSEHNRQLLIEGRIMIIYSDLN
ncbi:MAG: hypothetical protein JEY91_10770 [Spirochaetaceae bacterium]|nr:hypothetical protein [Spirochaetaceae bacterium]